MAYNIHSHQDPASGAKDVDFGAFAKLNPPSPALTQLTGMSGPFEPPSLSILAPTPAPTKREAAVAERSAPKSPKAAKPAKPSKKDAKKAAAAAKSANSAFVFVKPHAVTDAAKTLTKQMLEAKGIKAERVQ